MILDELPNWREYVWPSDRFRSGFEFLDTIEDRIADGTHPIDGDNVYCMVQTFQTRPRDVQEFEAHRQYADIQFIIYGEETILWGPQRDLTVIKPYEDDIEFYSLTQYPTQLILSAGQFAVFYPRDAHAPCMARFKPSTVRKAVIKVKIDG